jgi:hypothetical protein
MERLPKHALLAAAALLKAHHPQHSIIAQMMMAVHLVKLMEHIFLNAQKEKLYIPHQRNVILIALPNIVTYNMKR